MFGAMGVCWWVTLSHQLWTRRRGVFGLLLQCLSCFYLEHSSSILDFYEKILNCAWCSPSVTPYKLWIPLLESENMPVCLVMYTRMVLRPRFIQPTRRVDTRTEYGIGILIQVNFRTLHLNIMNLANNDRFWRPSQVYLDTMNSPYNWRIVSV